MNDRPEMITQAGILSRNGWSKTLIANLLGEPDLRKKIFGRSVPACLYRLDRVVSAESTPDFTGAQESLAKRRAAAEKATKTKIDKLMADIDRMQVSVKVVSQSHLWQLAIDAYNDRNYHRGEPVSRHSDPVFLDRICVNFIRHELTGYDQALWEVAGKTGKSIAVAAIRQKVYGAIAKAYPVFLDECSRQIRDRCETQ